MKLIFIPKSHREHILIDAEKIMVKLKSRILMMKNIDKIKFRMICMRSMGKIKSRLTRCRGLRSTSEFTNTFKCQFMRTGSEEELFFMERAMWTSRATAKAMGRKAESAGTVGSAGMRRRIHGE